MSTWNSTKGDPEPGRRRSQRVILSLPVTVRTEGCPPDASFEEAAQTLIVNVHGALIALAGKVEKGQTLRLINPATREELLCRVIHLGPLTAGKAQIGVGFNDPSPDFWRITFPPEDWTSPELEPVARKGKK